MNNAISDTILTLINQSPKIILTGIAERVKLRRLEKNLTQQHLASRAGIPLATYRRFERTGDIALRGLVMLAIALDMTDEFLQLFSAKTYQNMDELLNATKKTKKRATKNG
ncbi:MAG: helix-turn-helix domain-containing protein [Candidatus Symbiothrix sp.]|jgi:transcriptional regulator with XRE-family HTH domain|nr:helix-turn-helix domain-containing protein [Candidatus Symbiothrix sp.]